MSEASWQADQNERQEWPDEEKEAKWQQGAIMQELKPAAYMHKLQMDLGQFEIRFSESKKDDFGRCGIDYDMSYRVDTAPLYALPATHRIVPVELLEHFVRLTGDVRFHDRLRAIIDQEEKS